MIAHTDKLACRPCLVMAYADSAHAAACARLLRRQGWEVHQTECGAEARRLAGILEPTLVVLDTQLALESGWLTAAKLLAERPHQVIFLIGPGRTPLDEQFASFLGVARFVSREETAVALEEVLGIAATV